ncbi:MAG: lipocalin family protein [Alistipes sp.]
MKIMMKFLLAAFSAVVLCSCGGDPDPVPDPVPIPPVPSDTAVVGEWQLKSWSDDVDNAISSGKVQVYLELKKDGTFWLYENFNTPGFKKIKGTFVYVESTKSISGTYSDGSAWAHNYAVSDLTTTAMKWTVTASGEFSTYAKTSIPADLVKAQAFEVSRGEAFYHFL